MRGYSMYVVKESGQFSCRGFRCLNVDFFYFLPVKKLNNKLIIPRPTFLSNPDCVVGIPVCRAKRCFEADIPNALFHENEKPYLDMIEYFN